MSSAANYRFEINRLKSYKKWLIPDVSSNELAKSGFYYTGRSDIVQCFDCNLQLSHWLGGDCPMAEHKRWGERCRFVRNIPCGNVPIEIDVSKLKLYIDDKILQRQKNQLNVGKQSHNSISKKRYVKLHEEQLPNHPDFSDFNERLKTFEYWPTSMSQTIKALAELGFYYNNNVDKTLCYYHENYLDDNQKINNSWIEHTNKFPKWIQRYINIIKKQDNYEVNTNYKTNEDQPIPTPGVPPKNVKPPPLPPRSRSPITPPPLPPKTRSPQPTRSRNFIPSFESHI